MPLHSLSELCTEVLKKFPWHIISSMLAYLRSSTISLQGSSQGDHYLETMLFLQLYKDTHKIGYDALQAACKNHPSAPTRWCAPTFAVCAQCSPCGRTPISF